MAKKRRTARKSASRPARRSKPARRRKHASDDTVTGLLIVVVIAIGLIGYYLYQQNAKKAGLPNALPAIVSVETPIAPA
jgi:uncharacterized protein HemX